MKSIFDEITDKGNCSNCILKECSGTCHAAREAFELGESIYKKTIQASIRRVQDKFYHVLNLKPALIDVNCVRALMQVQGIAILDELYALLDEKRPTFNDYFSITRKLFNGDRNINIISNLDIVDKEWLSTTFEFYRRLPEVVNDEELNVALVTSLPESRIESQTERGEMHLTILKKMVGREEFIISPIIYF